MTPDQAAVLKDFLVSQVEQEAKITSKVLAATPEQNLDYKPSEKCMPGRDLAKHIAFADVWLLEGVANGGYSKPDDSFLANNTIAELVEYHKNGVAAQIEKLRQLSPGDLAKDMSFFSMSFPRVEHLQFILKHTVHHRGQLSSYLRPMGGRVPSIYGGSADEPFNKEASA